MGVVSIEFNLDEIENFLTSLTRGFSFAFLTTSEGDLLVHPSYRLPQVVKNLPLYYDVSLIESSDNFANEIRRPLVTELSGFDKVLVDRPLPKGDIGTEGITTIPILTTFFWSRLTNLPFIVVLSYSDADLRSPFYTANADAGWISSSRVAPIFDDTDRSEYFPDDFEDDLVEGSSNGETYTLSYKYTAILDNFRSFLPDLQADALTQVDDEGDYLPDSTLMQPDTIKAIMTFINNLVTPPPYNRNPGFDIQVKELSRIGTIFNELWREDYLNFTDGTGNNDPTTARFMGFYTQSLITFPGFIDHPLGKTPFFQARFRPWYQRAEANPNVVTISSPYEDAFFGGKVITVSRAVFGDPSLSSEEREILGVVAVDYSYGTFHDDFVSATGCARERSDISPATPLCYIMDNSALVILSPDFLDDDYNTFDATESDTLPIGLTEPQLADQLVELELLLVNTSINFRGSYTQVNQTAQTSTSTPIDAPQELPLYSIDTERLNNTFGGTVTGTLTKNNGYCTRGQWTLSIMEETNLFLIYIENYDQDDLSDPDCRQFDLASIQNTSYPTCEQNAQLYPFSTDICPNSDQREFVVERLRPEESKCDRTPPKETEFVEWSDPVAIAMVAIASFLILFTFAFWGLVLKYRQTPVILMASPPFISMQFVGFILGYCNIYLWTGEPTDVQCAMRPWFASIAFVLVVGPMFAKTYRVWKLFSPKFFDRGISDKQVLVYVMAMLIFPIIVCIVWLSYERPAPTIKDDNFDDEKTVFRCDSEGISCRVFEGILIGYCGFLVALGSFFAFRSRKARSYFNEARFIGFSIYAIASCGIVGVTLSYVLLGLPIAYYVVFCVAVIVGIFATMMIVYFPKLKICIFKPETNVINKTVGERDVSIVSDPNLEADDSD
uniref:G-protein coupled receptors family 3 profile domain-containing protein n=1 Tax=Paramoeba aestuarina TaxID=180227 RepID=A0A7S4P2K4_9EUKA